MASSYLTSAQLSRIHSLRQKRLALKKEISETKHRAEPGFYLGQLKKQNLYLKDQINQMERQAANG